MTEKQSEPGDGDNASTKRQTAYLKKLSKEGGAPVRVDFNKDDLKMLDTLVDLGAEGSRAEVIRVLIRSAYSKLAVK